MSADIQPLVAALQKALGISVTCGQITININQGRADSFETKTKQRIPASACLTTTTYPADSSVRTAEQP